MENPYRLPPELAREMGERLAQVAVNRYPDPAAPALQARACARPCGIPEALELLLGNGSDEIIQIALARARAPGRGGARARALVRDVPPERDRPRACATWACRSTPTSRSTRRRCSPRSRAHRPALTWLAYPNNPDRQPLPARGDPARRRGLARAGRGRRGLLPVRGRRDALDEVGAAPEPVLVRTVSKLGPRGLRLGSRRARASGSTSSRSCARPTT